MSKETSEWLNNNVLVGFTSQRGNAWHYRQADQGDESNHYDNAVPVSDVLRRLFHWEAVSCTMGYDITGVLGADVQVWKPSSIGRQVIVRSDTLAEFGVFKEGYTIHQYRDWLISKVHEVNHQLEIGSAGLLKGGAQAWVSFEVPETLHHAVTGVDYRPQLIACTSHDGSLATTYKRATTIVVCDNTLTAGLGEKGQTVKVYHSKYSNSTATNTATVLGLYEMQADAVDQQLTELAEWKVSDKEWFAFLDKWIPIPEDKGRSRSMAESKREQIQSLWNNDMRVAPWHGTALGVLQAGNTWFHHNQIVRGATRAERNMTNALDDTTRKHDESVIKLLATVTG